MRILSPHDAQNADALVNQKICARKIYMDIVQNSMFMQIHYEILIPCDKAGSEAARTRSKPQKPSAPDTGTQIEEKRLPFVSLEAEYEPATRKHDNKIIHSMPRYSRTGDTETTTGAQGHKVNTAPTEEPSKTKPPKAATPSVDKPKSR